MGKAYINGQWYTELGRQIALNDVIRKMRQALNDYVDFHKRPTLEGMVKAAHKAISTNQLNQEK